ncbi:hypothetical protein L1987_65346 [Smallanthus sonchifolius]|uniref:Uncharacterized protein n=1 Tax=Smallanthus sonchifolius TaxID=185202 RepID=A0ACB9BU32_9ASTR|nr:hypothetical protein L1987_65346 [Smallanthus sonchifolius]
MDLPIVEKTRARMVELVDWIFSNSICIRPYLSMFVFRFYILRAAFAKEGSQFDSHQFDTKMDDFFIKD